MTQTPKITVIPPAGQGQKLMRVAAYCRVSSDSADQLHSYASQIQYYTDLIGGQPGWVLADIYADEGLTGTKVDKREDFLRMINDCRKGKIDRILTKSISRFARNTLDTIQYVRKLKEYGVTILFEAEQIDTAYLSSEMLLAISGARAQEESLSISKNLRMNCRARMREGTYIPSRVPYGYRMKNSGELEIVPEEAEVVQLIFTSFLSGMGKYKIADMLNERQAPKQTQYPKWHERSINYILKNERYMGDAILQKTYTTKTLPFRRKKNKGELARYYVENANPPIISREQFETAQSLMRRNYKENAAPVADPLTGKIRCSCGHIYTLAIVRGIRYWECRAHNQNSHSCDSRRIPETDMETAFINMVNKLRLLRSDILEPAITQLERLRTAHSGAQGKVHEIDRQIAELNGQNLVLARLHTKQILSSADYMAQSGGITQQVSLLRQERRRLIDQDESAEALDGLTELSRILSLTDCQTGFDENLFRQIVAEITAPTHTTLCFELLGGLKLTEAIPPQRRCGKR